MAKHDPDDQDITKEIDVSAFQAPEPLNVKEVLGSLGRAIQSFERAGDHLRDGLSILKLARSLLERFDQTQN